MKMEKLCLLSLLALAICACGGEKMELPDRNKAVEQKDKDPQEEETSPKKKDEKTKEEEEKKNKNPKNKEDENQEKKPAVELTLTQIEAYYGLDKNDTPAQAEERIRAFKEERRVDNKTLKINEVTSISRNDAEGSITFRIKGVVDGKVFEQGFTSTGFQRTPTEDSVARSLAIGWKNRIDEFDFESLLLKKDTQKYTVDYLKRFVDFQATTDNGRIYLLEDKDLAGLKVKSIELTDQAVQIVFTYGNTSTAGLQLEFDKTQFLLGRVKVNADFVKNRYMRGVFAYLPTYLPQLLVYDRNFYTVELVRKGLAKTKDDAANSFSFGMTLMAKDSRTSLIELTKVVDGFKPLSDLKHELKLTPTKALQEDIKRMFGPNAHQEGDITKRLENTGEWLKKTIPTLTRNGVEHSLSWAQTGSSGQMTLLGEINDNSLDLHFANLQFRLASFSMVDQSVELKVQLMAIDGQPLHEAFFTVTVNRD